MKKFIAILSVVLISVLMFTACSKENRYIKKLENNGYTVTSMERRDLNGFKVDVTKTKYTVWAAKSNNVVYIVEFKKKSDAQELYDVLNDKTNVHGEYVYLAGYKLVLKGKIVIFGTEDGVKIVE